MCHFIEPVSLKQFISHLEKHLRNRETVTCPFDQCPFKSLYSSFTSHKCRFHSNSTLKDFKADLVVQESGETGESAVDSEFD